MDLLLYSYIVVHLKHLKGLMKKKINFVKVIYNENSLLEYNISNIYRKFFPLEVEIKGNHGWRKGMV